MLGQLYGEFKFTDKIFAAIGAKAYNTPYINANDVRMTPNTFEGATVYGTLGGDQGEPAFRFGGGYISKIKQKNDDEFVPMSEAAGVKVDRGVYCRGRQLHRGRFFDRRGRVLLERHHQYFLHGIQVRVQGRWRTN